MAKKKITQLDPATSVNSDALFPLSQEDNNEDKTFKGTIEQLGDYINKSQDFNTLNTTSKKVIGAINEVLADANKDIISAITTPAPIMSFSDGGDNIPVNKLLVAVTAQQAGSGTPSPSSPLAITGWSGANINNTDKYQRLISNSLVAQTQNGITITPKSNGVYEISGTATANVEISFNVDEFTGFSDANRTVALNNSFANSNVVLYFYNGETSVGNRAFSSINRISSNYNDLSGATINKIQIKVSSGQTLSGQFMIEFYILGAITTVTVPFGDTYYGGVLDVVNGKLTVTHGYIDLANYSGTVVKVSSGSVAYFRFDDIIAKQNGAIISDKFEQVVITGSTSNVGISIGKPSALDHATIFFRPENPDSYTTTTILTYIQNTLNGLQVCYELRTPIEIALTPTQIATLSGLNNIYADCGDIQSIEYFNENADEIAELHRSMSDDFHIYSTAEQIVGKWIDGKTLYEKTVTFTTASTSNYTQQNLGLLVSEVDTIFLQSCFVEKSGSIISWDSYVSNVPTDKAVGMLYRGTTNLSFDYRVSNAWYSANASVTVRYTKAS